MLNFSIIVAMANNRAIGVDNKLLWHLPNDLKHFKNMTMDKPIVMGRKTFESIGRPLPGRLNVVITRDTEIISKYSKFDSTDLIFFSDIPKVLDYFQGSDKEVMIIGGGEIYKQFIDKANKIYLTQVDTDIEGDVYFPELEPHWQVLSQQSHSKDDKHKYNYQFIELAKQ